MGQAKFGQDFFVCPIILNRRFRFWCWFYNFGRRFIIRLLQTRPPIHEAFLAAQCSLRRLEAGER